MKNKKVKAKQNKNNIRRTLEYSILAFPCFLYFLIFHYFPMIGLIAAFKNYRFDKGIFDSPWVGFDNFRFFFESSRAWRVTRNTVGYGALFTIVGVIGGVLLALLLYEVSSRIMIKIYQTTLILPNFISWVIASFVTLLILSPSMGVLNKIIEFFGGEGVDWYSEPGKWPAILLVAYIWKSIGYGSIIYYAGLMGVNRELYEAAAIDGAGKIRQAWNISIPSLVPIMSVLVILSIGSFFRGDFGMFYNVPRNLGVLYSTTDIIDTFIYRALTKIGDIGMASAVGFFQSIMGLLLVVISNLIVKKVSPDNSLF